MTFLLRGLCSTAVLQPQPIQSMNSPDQLQRQTLQDPFATAARFESPSLLPPEQVQQQSFQLPAAPARQDSSSFLPEQAQRQFQNPSMPILQEALPAIPAEQGQRQAFQLPPQMQPQPFQPPRLTLATPPPLLQTTPQPSRFSSFLPSLFTSSANQPPQQLQQQQQPKPSESSFKPLAFLPGVLTSAAGLFGQQPANPSQATFTQPANPPPTNQQPINAPTTARPLSLPGILSQAATLFTPQTTEQSVPANPPVQPQPVIPPQQPVQPQQQQQVPTTSQSGAPSIISPPASVIPTTCRPLMYVSYSRGGY